MPNRINSSGLPPHKLTLKKEVCIILICNLDIAKGHCNGTRYIILGMKPFVLHARKLHGDNNPENDDIFIHIIPMPSGERRERLPSTVHKNAISCTCCFILNTIVPNYHQSTRTILNKSWPLLAKKCFQPSWASLCSIIPMWEPKWDACLL